MKIFFHKFELTPLRSLNAQEKMSKREGVFLMGTGHDATTFWEYFPHPVLGDDSVKSFLTDFPSAKSVFQKKAHLGLSKFRIESKDERFLNHQLYIEGSLPQTEVIKYKLSDREDYGFIPLLISGHTIRLDANGIFTLDNWADFENKIPSNLIPQIEYIEDPINALDWKGVKLNTASDFINGSPYKVKVYKPYRDFFPYNSNQVIFSAPMGHVLGTYLTYLELIQFGDLSLLHGLLTPDLYQEVPNAFEGSYAKGFYFNQTVISKFIDDLKNKNWIELCTI